MKHSFRVLTTLVLVVIFLSSCNIFGDKTEFKESDLIGRWQAPSESDLNPEGNFQYCVFLAEKDSAGTFRYGYMWDMGDHADWEEELGSYEQFLLTEEYHGNGWFKWKLSSSNLMEYHFMSEGWAEVPKSYTLTMLTQTTLTYQDNFKKSHSWTRMAK